MKISYKIVYLKNQIGDINFQLLNVHPPLLTSALYLSKQTRILLCEISQGSRFLSTYELDQSL
jgi:hypothetical protein